jgi:hypothetical protein
MTEERRNDDGTISEEFRKEFRNKFEESETETLEIKRSLVIEYD